MAARGTATSFGPLGVGRRRGWRSPVVAVVTLALLLLGLQGLGNPATAAPVGQGFTVTPADLALTLPAGNHRLTVAALNAVGQGPQSGRSNQVVAR